MLSFLIRILHIFDAIKCHLIVMIIIMMIIIYSLMGRFFVVVADHEVIQEHSLPQIRSGINWLNKRHSSLAAEAINKNLHWILFFFF